MDEELNIEPDENGNFSVSTFDVLTTAYEKGLFNKIPCGDKEDKCFFDIGGLDKDRFIMYFDKRPEFLRVDHDDKYTSSTEFISDEYDIEIFDNFIAVHHVSGKPLTEEMLTERTGKNLLKKLVSKIKPSKAIKDIYKSFTVIPADKFKSLQKDAGVKHIDDYKKALAKAENLSKQFFYAYVYGEAPEEKFADAKMNGENIKNHLIKSYKKGKVNTDLTDRFVEFYATSLDAADLDELGIPYNAEEAEELTNLPDETPEVETPAAEAPAETPAAEEKPAEVKNNISAEPEQEPAAKEEPKEEPKEETPAAEEEKKEKGYVKTKRVTKADVAKFINRLSKDFGANRELLLTFRENSNGVKKEVPTDELEDLLSIFIEVNN